MRGAYMEKVRSGVDVRLFNHPRAQTSHAFDGGIEVIDLEPQKDAMAVGCPIGAHQIGVLLGIPTMQLEDEGLSTPL